MGEGMEEALFIMLSSQPAPGSTGVPAGDPPFSRILRKERVMGTVDTSRKPLSLSRQRKLLSLRRPWNPTLQKTGGAPDYAFESGSSRIRFPVAAKIALQTAGANGGTPGSPTPPGGASLSQLHTLVLYGASLLRAPG